MNSKALLFWEEYRAANDVGEATVSVAEFGDSPELAAVLADLIVRGIKTATCSSYQAYLDENAMLPEVGSYFMVVGADGDPVCLCLVSGVHIAPFSSADAAFAFDEGEDDRSLAAWQRDHRRFFGLPAEGSVEREDGFLLVFERFRRVWP